MPINSLRVKNYDNFYHYIENYDINIWQKCQVSRVIIL